VARSADDAEHVARRQGRDVLLFIANIFSYSLGGRGSFGALGRMPFASVTSRRWQMQWGSFRSASPRHRPDRLRRCSGIVPSDDYSTPRLWLCLRTSTVRFAEALDCGRGLFRQLTSLASPSKILDPLNRGRGITTYRA